MRLSSARRVPFLQKRAPAVRRKLLMADRVGFEPTSRLRDYLISSAAPSTTRTTLRVCFHPVFFPKICLKIRWGENRRESKKYSILRFSVLRSIKDNRGGRKSQVLPKFRVLFALGTFVSAVAAGGSFGNGENPCAATNFGRVDRY